MAGAVGFRATSLVGIRFMAFRNVGKCEQGRKRAADCEEYGETHRDWMVEELGNLLAVRVCCIPPIVPGRGCLIYIFSDTT